MITLYGISNCDTVKKARTWLAEHEVVFEFINFKNHAPSPALIDRWLEQVPLESLLNKRGTTWRQLSEEQKATVVDINEAVRLMAEHPSVIKRPILEYQGKVIVGFSIDTYQKIFKK